MIIHWALAAFASRVSTVPRQSLRKASASRTGSSHMSGIDDVNSAALDSMSMQLPCCRAFGMRWSSVLVHYYGISYDSTWLNKFAQISTS